MMTMVRSIDLRCGFVGLERIVPAYVQRKIAIPCTQASCREGKCTVKASSNADMPAKRVIPTLRSSRVVLRPGYIGGFLEEEDRAALGAVLREPRVKRWWGSYGSQR